MLPSEVPRLTIDLPVRVFPGVWKLLFFKTPFPRWISIPTSFVSLFIFYIFFLPSFEDNGMLFWVPDVLCWHSEVVLWNLLSVQMFFWWICGGESGLPVLFLCHLRTAHIYFLITSLNYLLYLTVIEYLFLRPFENITFCINIKTECR